MKDAKIEVPAVAWWALIALLIPVLQSWIGSTFPGSEFVWAPLAVAALGALLKWISWVMQQNGQEIPDADGEQPPFPASAVYNGHDERGQPMIDYAKPASFDALDFFLGVKRG